MSESERTPVRKVPGRTGRVRRVVTSGFEWKSPEQVPGAVLTADAQRRLTARLRDIDEAQARAMVSARNYVVYR